MVTNYNIIYNRMNPLLCCTADTLWHTVVVLQSIKLDRKMCVLALPLTNLVLRTV